MPDTKLEVLCPKCGSADIREHNIAVAAIPVTEWERDKDGAVIPTSWDWDVARDADWETDDREFQYECGACNHRLRLDDLTGVEVPDV
jgi:Zn finger protein HypA/HybF involved in hydrogenase expression